MSSDEMSSVSFDEMWSALAPIGHDPATSGYRRFAWTEIDRTLREWFAGECAQRGLTLTVDRAGNQWGWWGDPDVTPGVVSGSHLDSVPDGGAFDGPLGVVTAFAAIDRLRNQGFRPRRPIGAVNFVDEEGARFGVACAGSRLITGALDPGRARALTDAHGVRLAEAMAAAGQDVAALGRDDEALRRIGAFVELHVEQGRALADLDRPVAIGTSIWPHGRWRLDLPGQANHAGTTRFVDRHDPMLTLADVVKAARDSAVARGCVATVGKLVVEPNGVNAIPSRVVCWLDARGPDEVNVRAVAADVGVAGETNPIEESFTPDTRFDPELCARLAKLLDDAPLLGTGAGHDAGVLSSAGIPCAMLFVRNPTGVSHSPAEFAERDDCLAGVDALTRVLMELAS